MTVRHGAEDRDDGAADVIEVLTFILKLVPRIQGMKTRVMVAETVRKLITMSPKKYKNWRKGSKISVEVLELLGKCLFGKIGDFDTKINRECLALIAKQIKFSKLLRKSKKTIYLL